MTDALIKIEQFQNIPVRVVQHDGQTMIPLTRDQKDNIIAVMICVIGWGLILLAAWQGWI